MKIENKTRPPHLCFSIVFLFFNFSNSEYVI